LFQANLKALVKERGNEIQQMTSTLGYHIENNIILYKTQTLFYTKEKRIHDDS